MAANGLLTDRTVLVVGATGGIGGAIAAGVREAGGRLLAADLAGPALDAIDAPSCAVDLADVDGACAALAAFAAEHGPLDGLVNAAGVSQRTAFPEIPTTDWRRILDVDLVAPSQLVQALVPHLRAPGASIVHVTSIESEGVYASTGASSPSYAAAKAGLRLATACQASDLGPRGIRVNAVAPGFIRTPMTERAMATVHDWLVDLTALGRVGEAADLAGPTIFLLSDAAAYVTGQQISVDGGMSLGHVRRGGGLP